MVPNAENIHSNFMQPKETIQQINNKTFVLHREPRKLEPTLGLERMILPIYNNI